jgi:quercetin dioxygenase-like cupin family protein
MKSLYAVSLALATSMPLACNRPTQPSADAQHLAVTHREARAAAQAFPGKFTGDVTVTPFLDPTQQLAASAASVAFEPGARTAWHTHPAGQTLFITSGTGWVQESGGRKIDVKPGDVIWTPPGVKHWHGATVTSPMAHIAVQGVVDGRNVDWNELVTDEQYTP